MAMVGPRFTARLSGFRGYDLPQYSLKTPRTAECGRDCSARSENDLPCLGRLNDISAAVECLQQTAGQNAGVTRVVHLSRTELFEILGTAQHESLQFVRIGYGPF